MAFQRHNGDVFLLDESLSASGLHRFEEIRSDGDNPLICKIAYRTAHRSSGEMRLRWNRISKERRDCGDDVDITLDLLRRGTSIGADILDVEFPVDPASIYDPDFATVAAAAFRCNPDSLAGVELLINSEHGAQSSLPIAVAAVGHGATGHRFSALPMKASVSIRFHLKAVDSRTDRITIRLARVFMGLKYDPYLFNPWYEYSRHVNQTAPTPEFKEIADDFVRAARELSKTLKFGSSQSFILPFEVIREGTPAFPMLCGTINSLYWYGMNPAHGIELYGNDGFVAPGDRVLDCGAHAGQMSVLFGLLAGQDGKVIAFDPFPQNYLQVEAQGRLNKLLEYRSARAGVGEFNETVKVPNAVQMSRASDNDHGLNDHLAITIHKIDDYLEFRPTAIKLDIEGAEVGAMRGAHRVLRECRPKLFCEFHTQLVGQFGHTVQDFFDSIPLDLYHVEYFEEGVDRVWRTYSPDAKQVWSNPGLIKAYPR